MSELPIFLQQLPRSDRAILDYLRTKINPAIDLKFISIADYGHRSQENYDALMEIYRSGTVPNPLKWVPREVIELRSHMRPDWMEWSDGILAGSGHLRRAFCCCVLICDISGDSSYMAPDKLAALFESCLEFGAETLPLLEQLILWRIEQEGHSFGEGGQAFFAMGYLLLYCARRPRDMDADQLKKICDWVVECGDKAFEHVDILRAKKKGVGWIFAATEFTSSFDIWKNLIERILIRDNAKLPLPLQERLSTMGAEMIKNIGARPRK